MSMMDVIRRKQVFLWGMRGNSVFQHCVGSAAHPQFKVCAPSNVHINVNLLFFCLFFLFRFCTIVATCWRMMSSSADSSLIVLTDTFALSILQCACPISQAQCTVHLSKRANTQAIVDQCIQLWMNTRAIWTNTQRELVQCASELDQFQLELDQFKSELDQFIKPSTSECVTVTQNLK